MTLEGTATGRSKGTGTDYDGGVPAPGTQGPVHRRGHQAGLLQRTEVTDARERPRRWSVGSLGGVRLEEAEAEGVGLLPAGEGHRTPDLVQVAEGAVGRAVGVDLGLVVAPAPQPDGLPVPSLVGGISSNPAST